MTQAKVQVALGASHRDELLALAALGVAAIRVDLLALRLALLVDVLAHCDVGLHSWGRGHGFAAEWTDGHLDVLPVGGGAVVPIVVVVRGAEDLVARVALHRQEIWRRGSKLIQLVSSLPVWPALLCLTQSVAGLLAAVLSQVRKLHGSTVLVAVFLRTKR